MFQFDVTKWVPRFILNDKNGYALAKAIEAGVQYMNDRVQEGVSILTDPEAMPEWRLDELAWELNTLYDYGANIESKRDWIKHAIPMYRLYGTPRAIYQYLEGYFDAIDLEENWVYGGDAFHFRVTVEGEWTPEEEAWARKAIGTAKNVRSVLDNLRIGHKCHIAISAEGAVLARFHYPMTGTENWAGRWPQENIAAVLDESGRAGVAAEAKPQPFPYPMTGVTPEINTLGALDESGRAGLSASATGYRFDYPETSETRPAGTVPQENTAGILGENDIQAAQAEDTYARIAYTLCGQDEI